MTLPTMLALPSIALAFMLIAIGLHGRPCTPHRKCKRCGYDLTGRTDQSAPCTECGADLAPCNAISYVDRKPNRYLVGLGCAILTLGSVHLGTLAVHKLDRIDWQSHKPAALLVYETNSSNTKRADAALDELLDISTVIWLCESRQILEDAIRQAYPGADRLEPGRGVNSGQTHLLSAKQTH